MKTIALVLLILLVVACGDDGNAPNDTFDRKAMLTDVADKVIVPAYDALDANVSLLLRHVDSFTVAPSTSWLDSCRASWTVVATSWQNAVTFDFGPAEGLYGNLSINVGTFPANDGKIETYIANGDTTHNNFDRDSRGVYGAEYLLFKGTPEEIVASYSGEAGSSRCAYLRSVVRRMATEISSVRTEWHTAYRDEFVSRSGTDAGSGTSLLFNNLNISFELLKNYKLALPLGKRAGQTSTEPGKVEALHSGLSKHLMDLHYAAVMRLWYGKSANGESILGFRDYLKTVSGGDRLIVDTEVQDEAIVRELEALGSSVILSEMITTSPANLEPLYTEMFKLTRFLKSEMSSLLGISITYSSGDGD